MTSSPFACPLPPGRLRGESQRAIFQLPFQVFLKVPSRLISILGIRLEATADDRFDRRRDVLAPDGGWGLRAVANHTRQHLLPGSLVRRERGFAREQLIENQAERVDVA